jgi:hypothetical protein
MPGCFRLLPSFTSEMRMTAVSQSSHYTKTVEKVCFTSHSRLPGFT